MERHKKRQIPSYVAARVPQKQTGTGFSFDAQPCSAAWNEDTYSNASLIDKMELASQIQTNDPAAHCWPSLPNLHTNSGMGKTNTLLLRAAVASDVIEARWIQMMSWGREGEGVAGPGGALAERGRRK